MNGDMPRDEGLSRLYREAAAGEPPPDLDRRILDAARQAAVQPPLRRRPRWMRWGAPAGLAATVVLTVLVTLLVEREHGDLMPRREVAPEAVPAAPQSVPSPGADLAAPPAVRRPAPDASPGRGDATAPAGSTHKAEQVPAATRPEAPSAAYPPQPLPRRDARGNGVQSGVPPATPPVGAVTAGRADGAVRERDARGLGDATPAAAPAPAPAVPAAPPMQAIPPSPPAPVAAPAPMPKPVPAEARKEMPARSEESAMPAPPRKAADRTSASDGLVREPAAWLEDIRRLLRNGREAEARDQLAAFRRAYPGHPLPEDLR